MAERTIAYFTLEIAIESGLPTYSGGLGALAGDTVRSAADLRVPMTAVTLLYNKGYFHQRLNADGWQLELFPRNDFYNMPVQLVTRDDAPVTVEVAFPGRSVKVRIWVVHVGRVDLYLLDTNVPENSPEDRQITGQLYGGDQETRIQQEVILGIGGVRMRIELEADE